MPASAVAGSRADRVLPVAGVMLMGGYALLTMWCITHTSYDVWGGLLIGPLLFAVTLPFLRRLARRDLVLTERMLVWALAAKLTSSLIRYWQSYIVYNGGADGERYNDAGAKIAQALHAGLPWSVSGPVPGTGVMEGITGYVYWVIGPTRVGGFFFFSWLGFLGLLAFQRAFVHAFPTGDARRYSLMLFFLPSLLFWPSSIGKEAWLLFCLGVSCYGAARMLSRRRFGLLWLAAGLNGAYWVRPHMAVLLAAALAVAFVVRPAKRGSVFGPFVKAIGVAAMIVGIGALALNAQAILGKSSGGDGSVQDVLENTSNRTDEGGSVFDATPVSGPADIPQAAVAVLLRPFPYEAHNVQSLVASAETLLVLVLAWRVRRRFRGLLRLLRREPWVAAAAVYIVLFVIAFSGFSNFGVLTRQRVQVYPFVLVLLALPDIPVVRRIRRSSGRVHGLHSRPDILEEARP